VAAPTSGVINLEPETGGQFKLSQNMPNPVTGGSATIPFTLTNPADVSLDIFDVNGKMILTAFNGHLDAGDQLVTVSNVAQLAAGSYIYQLTVSNSNGTFRQCKVMTVL
jgi:hypothetical protein